jgi:hypothetical protein
MLRKALATLLSLAVLIFFLEESSAQQAPTVIARSAVAPHDVDQTFKLLEDFFNQPANHAFHIEHSDAATHTIVAKRSGIDSVTWSRWAYCKVSTVHLLDTLQDGAVTVTAKASPGGNNTSLATVSADFVATYGLGNATNTVNCSSDGVLERQILEATGAQPPPIPSPAL